MQPYFLQDRVAGIAFFVAYIVWFVPELVGGFTQRSEAGAKKRDGGSSLVLYLAIFIGISLGFWSAVQFPALIIQTARPLVFWTGIVLILFGVLFRWYSIRVLGKYFTRDVAVRSTQTVVRNGPYRYIRHPSYTGSLISFLGLGIALGNWASIAAIMLCVAAGYAYRVRVEERALVEALGQPYRDYMQRTRRIIPFVI